MFHSFILIHNYVVIFITFSHAVLQNQISCLFYQSINRLNNVTKISGVAENQKH